MSRGLSDVYGLRVIDRLGPANVVRLIGAVFWLGILVWVPSLFRSDLIRPADMGSDSSNYAAAGERLVAGTSLYVLQAGDRPVTQDNPPEWSGAILSPPPVATPWVAMLVLGDFLRFHASWAAGLAASTAMGLYLVARLRAWTLAACLLALFPLGVVAWSGNLNALLAPALVLVWRLSLRERSPATDGAIGAIVAIAAVIKLGPAVLVYWLLAQRRLRAVGAAILTAALMLAFATWFGGAEAFMDYGRVVMTSAATPSPLSVPGLAARLGLAPGVGYAAMAIIAAVGCLVIVIFRRQPGATFAAAVVLSVVVTTIVRVETLVVALAALAPWATGHFHFEQQLRAPRMGATIAIVSLAVVAVALTAAILTGGTRYSSMLLSNQAGEPVIVRFTVPGQYATFGYELADGQVGTAWADQMGSTRSMIFVLTPDCRILYEFRADPIISAWTIGATEAVAQDTAVADFLDYSSTCAEEVRRRREGST